MASLSSSSRQIPAWAPLRAPLFRALWLASVASNIGSFMHEVGASWLMTELAPRADMVALVQAAGTLPIFFLALPAGALADVVDRRKLILFTQAWMVVVAGVLGIVTLMGLAGPWMLLLFTFLLAIGGAATMPAWQGLTPEIVKKAEITQAMALNGIAFNLSRIVGPALGGLIVGLAAKNLGDLTAPGVVFSINALSFLGVTAVLAAWKRPDRTSDLPPEHVTGALKAGARYVRHSPELRAILTRAGGFVLSGSALWSLLALFARKDLGLSATGYGSLLGFFGAGAVVGGLLSARLRQKFSTDAIVTMGMVGAAWHLLALAALPNANLVRVAMFFGGLAWTSTMLSFNIAVLRSVPDWVRSRASATFLLVFMGGQSVGAAFWGFVAQNSSILYAFCVAAFTLHVAALVLRRFRVPEPAVNLSPSFHWPEPILEIEPCPEDGPVLVTVEYEIELEQARDFVAAMQPVRLLRLRDGALRWNLWQDTSEPRRWMEAMVVESWNEHLRQHGRVTRADEEMEKAAREFHVGPDVPKVAHLLSGSAAVKEDS